MKSMVTMTRSACATAAKHAARACSLSRQAEALWVCRCKPGTSRARRSAALSAALEQPLGVVVGGAVPDQRRNCDAAVYRGRPFQIEAAIAFGGELAGDQPARVIRFANRVPLLFQQSACSSFKAVEETPWKNYQLQQPRGSLPVGPLVVMIHMASVWVPFTSESKEAIADYDEIRKEMKLALMECGRKLGTYLRKRQKMRRESERRDVFERYIGEISKALNAITGEDTRRLYDALLEQARKKTAVAEIGRASCRERV